MSEHPKKVVLLDLDGTLTKSDPGIIGCVVKAFEEMGYPVPNCIASLDRPSANRCNATAFRMTSLTKA